MEKINPHEYRTKLTETELFKRRGVKNVLEVCCGDGKNIERLTKAGFDVIGIESDEGLIKKASYNPELINRIKKHPIFDKALPFEDDSFDCVYSYQFLNHNFVFKIEEVFREIYRVLKPGGIFSIKISDMDQFNIRRVGGSIYEEQDPEFPKMKYYMITRNTYVKLEGKEAGIPHYAFEYDDLKESLLNSGFEIINMRKVRWNIVANVMKPASDKLFSAINI